VSDLGAVHVRMIAARPHVVLTNCSPGGQSLAAANPIRSAASTFRFIHDRADRAAVMCCALCVALRCFACSVSGFATTVAPWAGATVPNRLFENAAAD
jgi:hypothetical protein